MNSSRYAPLDSTKPGLRIHVVMDVVHPDGQRPQRKLGRIGLQIHSRRSSLRRAWMMRSGISGSEKSSIQSNKAAKREQGGEANPLTVDPNIIGVAH